MKKFYVCWVDDIKDFVKSYDGHIDILKTKHDVDFIIDEHLNADNFESIARNIGDDLIFFVDYNLKSNDGKGIDGDAVIKLIRKHNQKCIVVFYSSKATQEELRKLLPSVVNVICVLRESLQDVLTEIADGTIHQRLK